MVQLHKLCHANSSFPNHQGQRRKQTFHLIGKAIALVIPSVHGTEVQNLEDSRTAFQIPIGEEQPLESLMSSKESSRATSTHHKHLSQCHAEWEEPISPLSHLLRKGNTL